MPQMRQLLGGRLSSMLCLKWILLSIPLANNFACSCAETRCTFSDSAQQELSVLLQQADASDAHTSFDLSSGGETWEQNLRRIATDVVCFC